MAETPEIPEVEDRFSQKVAITIAVLAVLISVIGNRGDNAKTESILKTTEAANQWSYFQSKSIKEHAYEINRGVLEALSDGSVNAEKREALTKRYDEAVKRYKKEKQQIGPGVKDEKTGEWVEQKDEKDKPIVSAAQLEHEARHCIAINDRTDQSTLLLQIAVILCSVAILVKLRPFWWLGMGIGGAGAAVGLTAFLM